MKIRLLAILALVTALMVSFQSQGFGVSKDRSAALARVSPWVLEKTAGGHEAEFLIVLNEQADLRGADNLATKEEKGRFVYNSLYNTAKATQGPLLRFLTEQGVEHRSYYIVNMIWAKGDRNLVMSLAMRADVMRIEANPRIKNPIEPPSEDAQVGPAVVEGGVSYIRAPEVWAQGFTGEGIVVGGADTGYRWDHSALIGKYRGWNGATANHDYNWHDSIHTGGGSCGPDSPQPCDDNGHGTHTMGTAVGDDGAGNQIGVAPGAKWIGCRNMNQGVGTPATYMECFEFFLAPYPVGGTPAQGNPSKAPHVTVNSWGCPPSEGCSATVLQAAVEAQRAAGIVTVVAAGNSGSSCSSVVDPPAIYDASYSVGAFDHRTGNLASFSSRGPVIIDDSNRLKPDVSAPGVGVRSSTRSSTTAYGSSSGTSMAAPHVGGAVALLMSARPSLRNNVNLVEEIINAAATPVSTLLCNSTGTPNYLYGFGRMDIKEAVDVASTSFSPSSMVFPPNGGSAVVQITAPAGASWSAATSDNWITVSAPGMGTGYGSVTFLVATNFAERSRAGTITIARQTFTVRQLGKGSGECSNFITPGFASLPAAGGSGTVNVIAAEECIWSATSGAGWITITSDVTGLGRGAITYSVAQNSTGAARTGTITVAGRTFVVKQKP